MSPTTPASTPPPLPTTEAAPPQAPPSERFNIAPAPEGKRMSMADVRGKNPDLGAVMNRDGKLPRKKRRIKMAEALRRDPSLTKVAAPVSPRRAKRRMSAADVAATMGVPRVAPQKKAPPPPPSSGKRKQKKQQHPV